MMPDSSFPRKVLYARGIVRKIEGHLRLAFAHWDTVLPPCT